MCSDIYCEFKIQTVKYHILCADKHRYLLVSVCVCLCVWEWHCGNTECSCQLEHIYDLMAHFAQNVCVNNSVALWPDFGFGSAACLGRTMQSLLSSGPPVLALGRPACSHSHWAQVTSMACEAGCICNRFVAGIEYSSGWMRWLFLHVIARPQVKFVWFTLLAVCALCVSYKMQHHFFEAAGRWRLCVSAAAKFNRLL